MIEQPRTTLHASHSGASARYCAQIPPTHDATMLPPQLQHPLRLPLKFLRTQKKQHSAGIRSAIVFLPRSQPFLVRSLKNFLIFSEKLLVIGLCFAASFPDAAFFVPLLSPSPVPSPSLVFVASCPFREASNC